MPPINYLVNGEYGTGYEPDLYDYRDRIFSTIASPAALPSHVDPLDTAFPIYDQKQTNACVGFSYKAAAQIVLKSRVELSAGFIWYLGRKALGWETRNAGCRIRDAIKAGNIYGCASEAQYETSQARLATPPTGDAIAQAGDHPLLAYAAIEASLDVKAAVAAGDPVILGTVLTESFEAAKGNGGFFPVPRGGMTGAHAMVVVGYDDSIYFPDWNVYGGLRLRNSWTTRWGDKGYGWMPYKHFDTPAVQDCWMLSSIKE